MKDYLQEKEYYTFIEVVTALKEEYKKVEEILKKLKEQIKVDSKYKNDYDLVLSLKDGVREEKDSASLYLRVSKKTTSIPIAIRQFMNKYDLNELRECLDNATFILNDDENTFEKVPTINKEKEFSPVISIKDNEKFKRLYEKLKQTNLFKLKSLYIKLNPYQTIYILGNGINLYNIVDDVQETNIKYDSKSASIKITSDKKYSTVFIEDLLDTKIPKYYFPQEYLEFLEQCPNKERYSFIDDTISKKNETLDFINKGKSLVLVRRNYK